MKKDKSYGAIVINDNNEVLLVKHNKGHWGLPKGHKEGKETDKEAAIREVKEETNVDINIVSDLSFTENYIIDNKIDKDVIYFVAKPISSNLINQEIEISEVKYIPYGKVIDIIDYDDSKIFWNKVVDELKKNGFLK